MPTGPAAKRVATWQAVEKRRQPRNPFHRFMVATTPCSNASPRPNESSGRFAPLRRSKIFITGATSAWTPLDRAAIDEKSASTGGPSRAQSPTATPTTGGHCTPGPGVVRGSPRQRERRLDPAPHAQGASENGRKIGGNHGADTAQATLRPAQRRVSG